MNAITMKTIIGEDRHLELDLPNDAPTGPVEVVIRSLETRNDTLDNSAREAARTKLLAAGALVTSVRAPEGTVPLAPEELLRIGRLPEGARSSEDLINEDRGIY